MSRDYERECELRLVDYTVFALIIAEDFIRLSDYLTAKRTGRNRLLLLPIVIYNFLGYIQSIKNVPPIKTYTKNGVFLHTEKCATKINTLFYSYLLTYLNIGNITLALYMNLRETNKLQEIRVEFERR